MTTEEETWRIGDWMQTFTGIQFYPADPKPEDINPQDIAHALSLLCRYGGHVDRFYSVAEHCVLMSEAVPENLALTALLHDATEAYIVDMPRPVKRLLPEYLELEEHVWYAITDRFGLDRDFTLPNLVKEADNRILLTERAALMSNTRFAWSVEDLEPLPVTITGWKPEKAEDAYLRRLQQLLEIQANAR